MWISWISSIIFFYLDPCYSFPQIHFHFIRTFLVLTFIFSLIFLIFIIPLFFGIYHTYLPLSLFFYVLFQLEPLKDLSSLLSFFFPRGPAGGRWVLNMSMFSAISFRFVKIVIPLSFDPSISLFPYNHISFHHVHIYFIIRIMDFSYLLFSLFPLFIYHICIFPILWL